MDDLYSFSELAIIFNMNKGNLIKLIQKMGLKTFEYRSPEHKNQIVKAINKEGFDLLNKYRLGPDRIESDILVKKEEFYLIQICPDISLKRIKIGYTTDIEQRIGNYKTICPTCKLIKTWPCKRIWEKAIIDMAIVKDFVKLGDEVFDCDIEKLIERLDLIFKMFEE